MIENKSLSLEEQVFRTLEEEIISGVYAAGESLTELGLSAKLGVSRTPVRSALHRLAEEGLVSIAPNRGAMVVGVTLDDLIDTYKIRIRLEGLASRMATERLTPRDKS
ncbi:MAG: GntR family transcriptional regulator, partial [Clostridia bacterium]|nr:GntR family transcriptional regulator [Clostridia bacterium]